MRTNPPEPRKAHVRSWSRSVLPLASVPLFPCATLPLCPFTLASLALCPFRFVSLVQDFDFEW